jgi:DNA-binding XRE family transcriptional regulator
MRAAADRDREGHHHRPRSLYWNVISADRSGLPVACLLRCHRQAGWQPEGWSYVRLPGLQHALGLAAKRRREELGITQEALANDSGLHQRWISNLENGKCNPSYASLRRLAAGLDQSASELLARAEQIEASEAKALNTR